jgi:hypothetical protein
MAQTPPATVSTLLIASVLLTICPTKRRTAPSKFAIPIPWRFPESIPQVDKHFLTPSPPSLSVLSRRYPTPLSSLRVRTVKPIRVLQSTPILPTSLPQPQLLLIPQTLEQVAAVLVRAARLVRHLPADPVARELFQFLFSRASLALHSLLLSLRNCNVLDVVMIWHEHCEV